MIRLLIGDAVAYNRYEIPPLHRRHRCYENADTGNETGDKEVSNSAATQPFIQIGPEKSVEGVFLNNRFVRERCGPFRGSRTCGFTKTRRPSPKDLEGHPVGTVRRAVYPQVIHTYTAITAVREEPFQRTPVRLRIGDVVDEVVLNIDDEKSVVTPVGHGNLPVYSDIVTIPQRVRDWTLSGWTTSPTGRGEVMVFSPNVAGRNGSYGILFVIRSSMKTLMVLVVLAALGLATWISGVGIGPFIVVDAVIPVVIVPAVLVMIGISPAQFVGAFRTAFRPGDAPGDVLVAARAVLKGFSRMILISLTLFVTIGLIAMIHDMSPEAAHPIYGLLTGSGTLLVDLLYALLLQGMVVQPLIIRLERAIGVNT
jgi:hypothetical protein